MVNLIKKVYILRQLQISVGKIPSKRHILICNYNTIFLPIRNNKRVGCVISIEFAGYPTRKDLA